MSAINDWPNVAKFEVDGILFDMDGTLTDSIAAVEAAWTAKAEELGLDPEYVIAATHGRRASDNLQDLIPDIQKTAIAEEVDRFEKSILEFADTPPQSRRGSQAGSRAGSRSGSRAGSRSNSRSNSVSSSRRPSFASNTGERKSFGSATTKSSLFPMTPVENNSPPNVESPKTDSPIGSRRPSSALANDISFALTGLNEMKLHPERGGKPEDVGTDDDPFEAEDLEDADDMIDMSVQILPGVRALIDSLPADKYAVATSGAKTYCHGCLKRTNIKIPDVCVTADDPRLKRGKPHPDPFLLAASDLGVDPKKTVIFEDSPSGIKAAVAAGGTVIAVCTSHKREQISHLGAHYVVETMDQVKVTTTPEGRLAFQVAH